MTTLTEELKTFTQDNSRGDPHNPFHALAAPPPYDSKLRREWRAQIGYLERQFADYSCEKVRRAPSGQCAEISVLDEIMQRRQEILDEHFPLFNKIQQNSISAGVALTELDRLLCRRICSLEEHLSEQARNLFAGVQTGFESEFFVTKEKFDAISDCTVDKRVPSDEVLIKLEKETYKQIGCEFDDVSKPAALGRTHKLEAKTALREGKAPIPRDMLKEYFSFRAKIQGGIKDHYPDHHFHRYGEHLHFSLNDSNGAPLKREAVPDRLQASLEIALQLHWDSCIALLDKPNKTAPGGSHYQNGFHTKQNAIGSSSDIDTYFLRYDQRAFLYQDFNVNPYNSSLPCHYEVRRVLPGPDRPERDLIAHPMIFATCLVLASLNVAAASYYDNNKRGHLACLAANLESYPVKANTKPTELWRTLFESELITHHDGLGPEIGERLKELAEERIARDELAEGEQLSS